MQLISNKDQLLKNLERIENYLTEGSDIEKNAMTSYIKRGTCFICYKINNEIRFAPSRFSGYVNNTLKKHIPGETDGRETNEVINNILNQKPTSNNILEKKYAAYCKELGIKTSKTGSFGAPRKYWTLDLKVDFDENLNLKGEFPEGKIKERIHKYRERNSEVVRQAKANFKIQNKKLYCQVCGFDFEKTYGIIGKDFIEAHHTIAVSDMEQNHKTKVEDFAILCSNCHSMVHKKRPWLTMKDLSTLIKKRK